MMASDIKMYHSIYRLTRQKSVVQERYWFGMNNDCNFFRNESLSKKVYILFGYFGYSKLKLGVNQKECQLKMKYYPLQIVYVFQISR